MSNEVDIADLGGAISKVLKEYAGSSYEKRQTALDTAAKAFADKASAASPRASGQFAQSWRVKQPPEIANQYPDHRYVGSTRTVDGKGKDGRVRQGIPLSNVLAANGVFDPQEVLDACETEIIGIIQKSLED